MLCAALALLAACAGAAGSIARAPQRRIFNGYGDSQHTGQFKFAVLLEAEHEDKNYGIIGTCSGSMITVEWVLTAAHCLVTPVYGIRWGNTTAPRDSTSTHSRAIAQYPHPYYREQDIGITALSLPLGSHRDKKLFHAQNDIGLVLVQKVKMKSYAKISAVDYQSLIGQEIMIAGFGMRRMNEGVTAKRLLQVAEGTVVKCGDDFTHVGPVICLSSKCAKQQTAWNGDSGGPLLHDGKVAGVASLAASPGLGGYTPVSPYLHWIRETMQTKLNAPHS